jgi:Na+-translocating ferredoxin:NAD+ oxidoreductase RNF subunit RnfB
MYKNINRCKWPGGEKKTKKLIKKLIEKTKPKNKKNKPIKKKVQFQFKNSKIY